MTRPARFAFVHFIHCEAPGSNSGRYNAIMTMTAGKIVAMFRVTERNRSGVLDCEETIRRSRRVAFFAIFGDTESSFAVMTRSTRFSLLHLRHRITDTADPADKKCTVTFIAFKHLEMVAMAESGVKSLETDLLDVFMAFLAIAFGGKSRFSVVTGST